jgi:hypothetical protein
LPDAVPGRFTGAVFVATEKPMDAGFDAALTRLANLRRSGVLMTSLVDCYGPGMTGPVRLGTLGSPCRRRIGLMSKPVGAS